MNILILTLGSRGDVQPYVALGQGLQKAGHAVTICTSSSFEPFIREHGLDYAFMNNDIVDFVDGDAGRQMIEEASGVVGFIKVAIKANKLVKEIYGRTLREEWQAAQAAQPDLVIFHPKALGGYHIAEALNIPAVVGVPFPYAPTGEFSNFVFPKLPLGAGYNRLTHNITVPLIMLSYGKVINEWRTEVLGLPKRGTLVTELKQNGRYLPHLHALSPHVLPEPADWQASWRNTGYWFLDAQDDWQPPADLVSFLDAGEPPIYVGFGSIGGSKPEETADLVINALQKAGQRGLIASGWGGLKASNLPESIFAIESAPHDWLFPRMKAVVHHGGAGTTAAGLRAGRPSLVLPFFGDQPFWGEQMAALGVGPDPIPQKKLTVDNLATALRELATNEQMAQKAAVLGEKIRAEDGIQTAVQLIEAHAAAWASGKTAVLPQTA